MTFCIPNPFSCCCVRNSDSIEEQQALLPREATPHVKTYDRVLGTIQCLRGKAFRVQSSSGPDFFVNKDSVARTFAAQNPSDARRLAQDKRVREAFLSAVAPFGDWQGTTDTHLYSALGRIQTRLLEKEAESGGSLSAEQVTAEIEGLNPRKALSIRLDELLPGDIIWTRLHDDATPTVCESCVIQGQKITRGFLDGPRERDCHRYIHVGLYVGEGRIAEAMLDTEGGPELRMVGFDHSYYTQESHDYRVTRILDPDLSEAAASIARELTLEAHDDLPEKLLRRYNMTTAVMSVLQPSWKLEIPSLIRILHAYHQLQQGEASEMFGSFHCSYFVPFVFQLAEAQRLMPDIERKFAVEPVDTEGTVEKVQGWASEFINKIEQEMEIPLEFQERLLFKINARRTSPQELRIFFSKMQSLDGKGFPKVEEYKLV